MQSYYYAKKRIDEIERRLKSITAAAKKLPEGRLNVSRSSDCCRMYQIVGHRGQPGYQRIYLGKSRLEIAEQLAYKQKLKDEYYALKKELELLLPIASEDIASCAANTNYLGLPCHNHFDANAWMHEDYPSTAGYPEHLKYKAIDGRMVRSKAEADYIQLLCQKNIPYRYECDLYRDGEKIACPDFTLIKPSTLEVFYAEHFGKVDDPFYVRRNINKIQKYIEHGIYPMINLIVTCETNEQPLDITFLDKMLDHFLLQ